LETSLSTQSTALALTVELSQQENKHLKLQKNNRKYKPKSTGTSSGIRTAPMNAYYCT